ncbi:MotA/TolQ/ExbB proton channel family protein [uncultured Desulfosarcina sp.]|uniref:MotA/TolQ/ExbB proton channel family protein n=1 Tax=uncultured Desulfosarcina sp. TaxID=218289 RepID=UPI0029C76BEF|nr:MotA/TolQ/ExbB proton channel family protein [uncultured Desulfosarcina sp.]
MIEIFNSGGPVMIPLLICSLISLTVIIERAIFWTVVGMRNNRDLLAQVMERCQEGDWEGVRKLATGSNSYVIRILVSGILHREYSMVKAMETAAADEIARMRRYMGVMDTIITVAPLLGIFGTVIGIIASFDMLGGGGIDHPEAVTRGIAQALITTASGLGIAIFTVFPYNYFNTRIERAARYIEKYATSLEIIYEKLNGKNESNAGEPHEG